MTAKTYTAAELATVLADHKLWLDTYWRDASQQKGTRAVLTRADLRDADLTGAVLTRADLRDADLTGAVLTGADLTGAVLTGADLRDADLRDADLRGAVLRDAVLRGADLRGAVLRDADLRGADLRDAWMRDGLRWEHYKAEVVPALCVAGGKDLDAVANPETWGCNSWSNCPMHAAFDADGISAVPPLYRGLANEFIQFFDAGLLPLGEINPKYADAPSAVCEVSDPSPTQETK
jgi:hypothetical protein